MIINIIFLNFYQNYLLIIKRKCVKFIILSLINSFNIIMRYKDDWNFIKPYNIQTLADSLNDISKDYIVYLSNFIDLICDFDSIYSMF